MTNVVLAVVLALVTTFSLGCILGFSVGAWAVRRNLEERVRALAAESKSSEKR